MTEEIEKYIEILKYDFITEYFQEIDEDDYFKLNEILTFGIIPKILIEYNKKIPFFVKKAFNLPLNNNPKIWQLLVCINSLENYQEWTPSNAIQRFLNIVIRVNFYPTKYKETVQHFIKNKVSEENEGDIWKEEILNLIKNIDFLKENLSDEILGWIIEEFSFISKKIVQDILIKYEKNYHFLPYFASKCPKLVAEKLLIWVKGETCNFHYLNLFGFNVLKHLKSIGKIRELTQFGSIIFNMLFSKCLNILQDCNSLLNFALFENFPRSSNYWKRFNCILMDHKEFNHKQYEFLYNLLVRKSIRFKLKIRLFEIVKEKCFAPDASILDKLMFLGKFAGKVKKLTRALLCFISKQKDLIRKSLRTVSNEKKIGIYGLLSSMHIWTESFEEDFIRLLDYNPTAVNACVRNYIINKKTRLKIIDSKENAIKFLRLEDPLSQTKQGSGRILGEIKTIVTPVTLYSWDNQLFGRKISSDLLGVILTENATKNEMKKLDEWFSDAKTFPKYRYAKEVIKNISESDTRNNDVIRDEYLLNDLQTLIDRQNKNKKVEYGFLNLYRKIEATFPWEKVLLQITNFTTLLIGIFGELLRLSQHYFTAVERDKIQCLFGEITERLEANIDPKNDPQKLINLAMLNARIQKYSKAIIHLGEYIKRIDTSYFIMCSNSEIHSPLMSKVYFCLEMWECFLNFLIGSSIDETTRVSIKNIFTETNCRIEQLLSQCEGFNARTAELFLIRKKLVTLKYDLWAAKDPLDSERGLKIYLKVINNLKDFITELNEKNIQRVQNQEFLFPHLEIQRLQGWHLSLLYNIKNRYPEEYKRTKVTLQNEKNPFIYAILNELDIGIFSIGCPLSHFHILPNICLNYKKITCNRGRINLKSNFNLEDPDWKLECQVFPPWVILNSSKGSWGNSKDYLQKIDVSFPRGVKKAKFSLNLRLKYPYLGCITPYKKVMTLKSSLLPNKHKSKSIIRWLHISDLHIKTEGDIDVRLLDFLGDLRKQIDYIIFTGDLAFSGKNEEFKLVRNYVLELTRKIKPKYVLVIPGNHDMNWSFGKRSINLDNQVLVREIRKFNEGQNLTQLPSLSHVLGQQKNYKTFWNSLIKAGCLKDKILQGPFNDWFFNDGTIACMGLNSVLGSSSDENRKLPQFIACQSSNNQKILEDLKKSGIKLLFILSHHPFTILPLDVDQPSYIRKKDRRLLEEWLNESHLPTILFTGHTHEPNIFKINFASGKMVYYSQSGEIPKISRKILTIQLGEFEINKKILKMYQLRVIREKELEFRVNTKLFKII